MREGLDKDGMEFSGTHVLMRGGHEHTQYWPCETLQKRPPTGLGDRPQEKPAGSTPPHGALCYGSSSKLRQVVQVSLGTHNSLSPWWTSSKLGGQVNAVSPPDFPTATQGGSALADLRKA